jgi:cell division protein FtsA
MARPQVKKKPVSRQEKVPAQTKIPMREQANDVVLAMDIGTRSIIGMVGVVEDGKVKIIAVEREEHAQRAMIDGQIENIEKVSTLAGKVKKRLEEKTRIKLTRVCVAAAGRALRTKRADYELELPGTQLIDDEIISRLEAGAITRAEEAFDAENESTEDARRFYLVGYTVCQYFLDKYMISNLKDHRGRQIKVDLIATFLPSEVVESLYTTMNKIGLEVASLTLEPIAAINAAIPENIRLLNLVLVDIGAGTSDIAACTSGSVTGYTMATMAGDEITEAIMKHYLVDFPTAEAIKVQLDKEDDIRFANILGLEQTLKKTEVLKCVQGTLEALSKEIADKVVEINGTAPSALFLAGGGSKLAGLKDGITEALGMEANRVAVAGNYFQTTAFSDEYDLNNPEYATPLGIAVSSGLNMINDSFRVTLNGRPAKLFRSGTFTALNLLMMNGYNFRDIMGRAGMNLTVTVNGRRKVFYGTASDPASLMINQKEGKLSDVIHAGDFIDFIPAIPGTDATARLGDVEGVSINAEVTLNGMQASLKTMLKNGDVITVKAPVSRDTDSTDNGRGREDGEFVDREPISRDTRGSVDREPAARDTGDDADREPAARNNGGYGDREPTSRNTEGSVDREPAARNTAGYMDREPGSWNNEDPGDRESASRDISTDSPGERRPESPVTREPKAEIHMTMTGNERPRDGEVSSGEKSAADGQTVAGEPKEAEAPGSGAEVPEEAPGPAQAGALGQTEAPGQESPGETRAEEPVLERPMVVFQLNGSPLRLPKKEDGRPYYLMDLIQYSGIDLDHPKGTVTLKVNGETGRFQQVLRQGDMIDIWEEERP